MAIGHDRRAIALRFEAIGNGRSKEGRPCKASAF